MVLGKKAKQLRMTLVVPDTLRDKVVVSKAYQSCDSEGKVTGFGVDLTFTELRLAKAIKSGDFALLQGKIENTLRAWEKRYVRHLDKVAREQRSASVEELTREAQQAAVDLEGLLINSLTEDDAVDWEAIKRQDSFTVDPQNITGQQPPAFIRFAENGKPALFTRLYEPKQPQLAKVKKEFSIFKRIFNGKLIRAEFERRHKDWEVKIEEARRDNREREEAYHIYLRAWEELKTQFEKEKADSNATLEDIRLRYQNKKPRAIEEYCDLVLNHSAYPDFFPHSWHLEYRSAEALLVVDYDLPVLDDLPSVAAYAYVKSEDQVIVRRHPAEYLRKLYDSVCYQVCLRTIHELFESDVIGAVDAVAFNGMVRVFKSDQNIKEIKVIMSVRAARDRFHDFDLTMVDPRATFKLLKGVSTDHLYENVPVRPVVTLARGDRREISENQLEQDSA
ncbi:MAG: hypothetical protein H6756_00350 [Candidatus Omnitrophica bacterium]|nr:hypothetical protein [Candidatus Omnitrophota bacterium]MCB9719304.1 hypothetical protein [Candidatus Omnitrophota bacterium]